SPLRRGEGSTSATVVALKIPPRFLTKIIAWTVGLLAISAGALATRNQLEYWRTGETLFRHCIEVTTNNFIAYNNVGAILVNQGKYDEALPFYSESMRINPRFADTVMNIGTLLAIRGDGTNAVAYLQQAVKLAPKSAECHGKLALALAQQGRIQEAVSSYRESLRLKADQV